MELLKSIVIDSTPSPTGLLRFAIVEVLKAIKTVLLLYPLNVVILCAIIFLAINRFTAMFGGKKKFKATYDPLPHHDSAVQELKLLKKEVREAQADLIALLKKGSQQQQQSNEQLSEEKEGQASESVRVFMQQVNEKSLILEEVQSELKQTVSDAFNQISRINQM